MKTPTPSQLAVTLDLHRIESVYREASLHRDPSGYLFVRYSGERELVELDREAFSSLLKLVKPVEYPEKVRDKRGSLVRGSWLILPEIDPNAVIDFLNRFGMVGLTSFEARNAVLQARDYVSLSSVLTIRPEEAKKLFVKGQIKESFRKRIFAIRSGDEIPYAWIEKTLRDLARSARLVSNLLEDDRREYEEPITLTFANQKRIVSAWSFGGGAFKDGDDPASSKFNLREEWKGGKRPFEVQAEDAVTAFAGQMNTWLRPLSSAVFITQKAQEFYEQNVCFETAFACYLADTLKQMKIKRVCEECGAIWIPDRIKEENKYCSSSCSSTVTSRRFREKKRIEKEKISAKTAGSKKVKPKVRKEKK